MQAAVEGEAKVSWAFSTSSSSCSVVPRRVRRRLRAAGGFWELSLG